MLKVDATYPGGSSVSLPIRSPTEVFILSSSTLQGEAWSALLSGQPDLIVAGVSGVAAGDAPALPVLPRLERPATILVDHPAPRPDLVRRLNEAASDAGLLILIRSYELAEVLPVLRAGATGCVSRDDTVGDLARAIIAAGRGEIALPPLVAAHALAALARGEPVGENPVAPLSEREAEVLQLLGRGLTNKDIAQTLFISVRTVEAHLRGIFGKLGTRSRTEAALWAARHGHGSEG